MGEGPLGNLTPESCGTLIANEWADLRHSRMQEWSALGVVTGAHLAMTQIPKVLDMDSFSAGLGIGCSIFLLVFAVIGMVIVCRHRRLMCTKLNWIYEAEERMGLIKSADNPKGILNPNVRMDATGEWQGLMLPRKYSVSWMLLIYFILFAVLDVLCGVWYCTQLEGWSWWTAVLLAPVLLIVALFLLIKSLLRWRKARHEKKKKKKKKKKEIDEANILRYWQKTLTDIIAQAPKTTVQLGQFFVSWNGVLTLAYKGFSPSLLQVKRAITESLQGLRQENDGSRWPKTTLGALRDGKTLSLGDLFKLRTICDTYNPDLEGPPFPIDTLSIVLFHCRSLERRISTEAVALGEPRETESPPAEELESVAEVMRQFDQSNIVKYLPNVQRPGNRKSHYRTPFVEATLVYDLETVPKPVRQFRDAVDQELPGMYCWFDDASLHMTVRALAWDVE